MSHIARIVFMGSDPIALPLLEWLHEEGASHGAQLTAVYSQPDRPKGRGQKLSPNPIATWALKKNLPLFRPEKPGAEDVERLRNDSIDLVLVMAYGHILRKSLLAVPPRGFVNFHASILPKFRGASPIETAVALGETETGVTLMRITPPMDEGPGCDAERVPIEPTDTGASMREKLARACVPLLARNLTSLLDGSVIFQEQDHGAATYCRRLEKADGALDFSAPAAALAARINGLNPWPGCYADHGEIRLKLRHACAVATDIQALPGSVVETTPDSVRIATGDGLLCIGELQRPGGKMLPAEDFLRGYELKPGSVLANASMTELLVSES